MDDTRAAKPAVDQSDDHTAAEEQQATDVVLGTFDRVDQWRRAPIYRPDAASPLHDDEQWPYLALSQLAKIGLDVAAEHLWTIQTLITAQQYQTFAFRSVLRTALVGATQAVWLLAPDDSAERMRRARVLLVEIYRHHLAYLDQLTELDDPDEITRGSTQQVRGAVRERLDQVRGIRADAAEKAKWNDTQAIEEAAAATFRNQPNVGALVIETLTEWKAGSGAAHGLVWPLLGTAGTSALGTPDHHGRVVVEAAGSLSRIVNAYMLAYHTTDYGWTLLIQRGSTPSQP